MFAPWAVHMIGIPLAILWAVLLLYGLKVFGRPAWIVALAAPLVYIWPVGALLLHVVCGAAGCD